MDDFFVNLTEYYSSMYKEVKSNSGSKDKSQEDEEDEGQNFA